MDFYTRTAYKRWLHLQEITVVLTQERKRQSTPDIADMARICGRKKEVHWKWNTEGHLFDRAGHISDSKTIFTCNSLLDDNFFARNFQMYLMDISLTICTYMY